MPGISVLAAPRFKAFLPSPDSFKNPSTLTLRKSSENGYFRYFRHIRPTMKQASNQSQQVEIRWSVGPSRLLNQAVAQAKNSQSANFPATRAACFDPTFILDRSHQGVSLKSACLQ
ncbi:MAG: hypothetical protein ACREEM_00650 [Blastocatellia bacterium]